MWLDVIHFFACFCLSNYTVYYKSQLPLYKEPHVSAADKFKPHLSTFLCFVARSHTTQLAAAHIKLTMRKDVNVQCNTCMKSCRVKRAITKLGSSHLLPETEPVSEVLFLKNSKWLIMSNIPGIFIGTEDHLKHMDHF